MTDTVMLQPQLPSDILAWYAVLPELWLAVLSLLLLVVGVVKGNKFTVVISYLAVLTLVVTGALLIQMPDGYDTAFGNMFITNDFTLFAKQIILIASAFVIVLSIGVVRLDKHRTVAHFEFPVLILLATLGMLLMVSANNLIALYVGLELQSLALYVLAAMNRDSVKSSEAGLKYFILGALASGIMLYGSSLIYGFSGTTDFNELAKIITEDAPLSIGVLVGMIFVMIGLAFKVSAAPFHMWTPDVYEGAPTTVTAFFASAPKVAALLLFVRVLIEPFGDAAFEWKQIIIVIAALSMLVGALGALRQTNIKRLLAYSSIGHVGYGLLGFMSADSGGVAALLIYLALYMTMTIGAFSCILMIRKHGVMDTSSFYIEEISGLSGLARSYPLRAAALAIFMFSMAGIPPFAGFWGKLFIFESLIGQGFYGIAVFGVVVSVIAAYYYLKVIKVMYFDEQKETAEKPIAGETGAVCFAVALFNLLFFIAPTPLLNAAKNAALSLF